MVARCGNGTPDNWRAINRLIGVQRHGVNQFLASEISRPFKQTDCRFRQGFLSLRYLCGRCGLQHQGTGQRLIMRCASTVRLVDRVDFPTALSLSSRSAPGLSALAPAQRAGAQRLCALGRGWRLGRCSKVVSYLRYTGRATNVAAMAAHDP